MAKRLVCSSHASSFTLLHPFCCVGPCLVLMGHLAFCWRCPCSACVLQQEIASPSESWKMQLCYMLPPILMTWHLPQLANTTAPPADTDISCCYLVLHRFPCLAGLLAQALLLQLSTRRNTAFAIPCTHAAALVPMHLMPTFFFPHSTAENAALLGFHLLQLLLALCAPRIRRANALIVCEEWLQGRWKQHKHVQGEREYEQVWLN